MRGNPRATIPPAFRKKARASVPHLLGRAFGESQKTGGGRFPPRPPPGDPAGCAKRARVAETPPRHLSLFLGNQNYHASTQLNFGIRESGAAGVPKARPPLGPNKLCHRRKQKGPPSGFLLHHRPRETQKSSTSPAPPPPQKTAGGGGSGLGELPPVVPSVGRFAPALALGGPKV